MVESYKARVIELLIETGALKIGGPFKLKSGRESPYFINTGAIADGESMSRLAKGYAEAAIAVLGGKFDIVFGPPYKGIPLAVAISTELAKMGHNKGWASYRKEEKTHGEATAKGMTKAERQKQLILGHEIADGSEILLVDDVITTGGTKYEALEVLNSVADNLRVVGGLIAADRQEIGEDGENAISKIGRETGVNFSSIITLSDIFDCLKETNKLSSADEAAFKRYMRAWGTAEVRKKYGLTDKTLINGRSVIPACDIDIEKFEKIIEATENMDKIGGYKIPATAGYDGWPKWVETARRHTQKPLIYDHQKAGNDIPDTGQRFMKKLKAAGFDAVILFPFTSPRTQVAWTGEALQQGLTVIVGGHMTHPKFKRSEGGYIADDALAEIYVRAARQGVRHFVVPGNQPDAIKLYRDVLKQEGVEDPILFAPGVVAQGGSISDAGKVAGDNWHAIAGRALTEAEDVATIRAVAKELTSQL